MRWTSSPTHTMSCPEETCVQAARTCSGLVTPDATFSAFGAMGLLIPAEFFMPCLTTSRLSLAGIRY